MNKRKNKVIFGLLTVIALFGSHSTSFANTEVGRTEVGVGFVEGKSSSHSDTSSIKSTDTEPTTKRTTKELPRTGEKMTSRWTVSGVLLFLFVGIGISFYEKRKKQRTNGTKS